MFCVGSSPRYLPFQPFNTDFKRRIPPPRFKIPENGLAMALNEFIFLGGERFERWLVLDYAGKNKWGAATWNTICDCGRSGIVRGAKLLAGKSKSCGCFQIDVLIARNKSNPPGLGKKYPSRKKV